MRTATAASAAAMALFLGAGPAPAAGSPGAEPFNFLSLDANARPAAMGGAYTALATDSSALLYNPAGLARVRSNEATFMHNAYVAGITQEYAAYVSPRGWGANVNFLNSGGVSNTTNSNPDGAGLGSAGLYDLAFSGGFGRAFGDALSLGAEIKYIRESIAGIAGAGAAFDLGALYAAPSLPGLALGLSLQNAGPTVKYEGETQNLPLTLRGGAAYAFEAAGQKCAASFDVVKERSSGPSVALGLETVLAAAVPIRLGLATNASAGPGLTTGVGYVHDGFSFDYAFVPFGDLGSVNRLSLTFRWGNAAERAASPPRRKEAAVPAAPAPVVAAVPARVPAPAAVAAPAPPPAEVEDADLHRGRASEKLGRLAFKKGDYAGAKNYFAQAIMDGISAGVKDPVVGDAYVGMGRCLLEEGSRDDALKFFKAFETGPTPETQVIVKKEVETVHLR
ncbi:MAG: PorV/PorQ family protein [Elusimicrobiota bacterium]